jgi:hypothetical protein
MFVPVMQLASRRRALGLMTTALLLVACGAPPEKSAAAPSPLPPPSPLPSPPPIPSLGAPLETIAIKEPRPGELHLVYDIADTPELWSPIPDDELVASYRARVAARLSGDISPRALLLRQRAIMAAIDIKSARGDAENGTLLLEGRAGTIGPATCLESLLFREQARRYPMLEHPSEFGAYILRGRGRVRVYFSSFESVGGKMRHEVSDRVRADGASGLEVTAHLHNHPFMFDRVPGDRMWTIPETVADVGGALAPSTNDVHAYRSMREDLGLRGAWVTNGLDAARFVASDFDRLIAAG